MLKTLAYACPHCEKTVEVDATRAGETVTCPVCGSPFRAEVPSARPIERDPAGKAHDVGIGSDEKTLKVLHPAMARRHPIRFVLLLLLLAGGIGLLVTFAVGAKILAFDPAAFLVAGGVLAFIPGLYLVVWWIQTRATTLIVTSERTIYREGILSRRTSEVRHEDVRNLVVQQDFLERILNVGAIAISSAGQDDLEIRAGGIPRPDEIAEIIRQRQ